MMDKELFNKGCFCAGWTDEVQHSMTSKQKKDLATLLLELEDIKKDFERITENKCRIENLWSQFNGGFATE